MLDFFAQVVIAARNDNGEQSSWIQYLVPLLVAIFWVVSGIMKAKNAKKDLETGGNKEKPEKTPRRGSQRLTTRSALKIQPTAAKPHKIFKKPTKQKFEIPEQKQPAMNKKSLVSNVDLDIDQSKILRPEEFKPKTTEEIIKFDDLNELKKAVLYHEILGKPVALRDVQN